MTQKVFLSQIEKHSLHFLLCVLVIMLLLFSAVNISEYLNQDEVLGVETQIRYPVEITSEEKVFWEEFLKKNPDYIPGWIELGRLDKAREIDPNYINL